MSPPGLDGHKAIYDPLNQRMVIFGGLTPWGEIVDRVYTLNLDPGGEVWTRCFPSGPSPNRRLQHAAIYDPVDHRMVIFFGYDGSSYLNDTWALTLGAGNEAWVQLEPSGTPPSRRYQSSAVYDSASRRVVVFGGFNGGSFLQDVWALDLAGPTWVRLYPSGSPPPARCAHSAMYDPVNQRMVLLGGCSSSFYNDVWGLALSPGSEAWTQLYPSGTPPSPRALQAAVYDIPRHRMVIYSGYEYNGGLQYYNDVWSLDLTEGTETCTELHPSGPVPVQRRRGTAVYDALNERMVAYGGNRYGGYVFGDTHVLQIGGLGVKETPIESEDVVHPLLVASHPNPLTRGTVIEYHLPTPGHVSLSIYNASGQLVTSLVHKRKEAGRHSLVWDGTNGSGDGLSSGTYFCQLELDGQARSTKMVLLK